MKKSIILLLVLSTTAYANDIIDMPLPNLIKAAEVKYALPEGLLAAMIQVESNGNHKAINKDDGNSVHKQQGLKIKSYGLMQMQLASARLVQRIKAKKEGLILKKKDLITPAQLMTAEVNIDYGAAYIKWILENHKNNVAWSITCWNAGVNSSLCKNKRYYGEYVGKVLNAMIEGRE